jgi:hypothetical protein
MNEARKQEELAHRLEQATAADPQTGLDPEASAWREGFSAWGNLLEAGNAVNQETLDRLLDISGVKSDKSEVRKELAPSRRNWTKYAGIASAALVVSLMVALGMLKYSPTIEPPPDDSVNEAIASNANSRLRKDPLAWDDSLDIRFARIEQQLLVAQYDSNSLGYSFDNVSSNIQSLTKELEQTSVREDLADPGL